MTTTPGSDPTATPAGTPSDRLWLRSELMGTQVITRDTGRRLGVVGEVVVDIDRREVVALGLRDNPLTRFLPGLPRWMPLESIRQVGDVILVDSADSLAEGFNPERYSKVINCQVVTEAGETLGKVLGFSFDIETGELTTLVLGALGIPLLGEGVLSTWELAVEEIVSSGPDRIIVYEGAEEKLKQLGTGLLEKLGIGGSSWEQEERERYRLNMVPVENQLAAGQPAVEPQQQRRIQPATSRRVEVQPDYEYVELDERSQREPLRQRRYLDEEEERGGERPYGRERERSDWPEAYGRERTDREPEPRVPAYRDSLRREPDDRRPDFRDDIRDDIRDDWSRQAEARGPLEREASYREPTERDPDPAYRQAEPAPRAAAGPRTPIRRSLRDDGPLDVEPMDLGAPPSPERRDLGDPW